MRCGAAAAAWLLPLALQLICAPAALRVSAVPSVPSGPSAAAVRLQAQLDAAQPGETIVVPPGEIVFSNVSLLVQGAVSSRSRGALYFHSLCWSDTRMRCHCRRI